MRNRDVMDLGYRRAVPVVISLLLLMLTGCSGFGTHPASSGRRGTDAEAVRCLELYSRLERAVADAGVRDPGSTTIAGFPYLRVDRFLASFADEPGGNAAFNEWVGRMQALDMEARKYELRNLPLAHYRSVAALLPQSNQERVLTDCARTLSQLDFADADGRRALREAVRVPDDYRTGWRVLGLYPLTAMFVSAGVRRWHRDTQAIFDSPLEDLPVRGHLVRYVPPSGPRLGAAQVSEILARSANNLLAVPSPRGTELSVLFNTFAPIWEVDMASGDDRIGAPLLAGDVAPRVDTSVPIVYLRTSHTRVDGRVLLQLNYIVWFPSRPKSGFFDPYGGLLDGINWRVTLAPDGEPLIYDAMHNCGCYHMFFPGDRLRLRPPPQYGLFEPPLVPQSAFSWDDGKTAVIRVAHTTHYLQRVYSERGPVPDRDGTPYVFDDYGRLRSLPFSQFRQLSLFGEDGIVPGTRRGESWFLWPMGVPAPGAMRQWGRHATAFVGRRHFDDPGLIESLFQLSEHPAGE